MGCGQGRLQRQDQSHEPAQGFRTKAVRDGIRVAYRVGGNGGRTPSLGSVPCVRNFPA